LERVIPSFLSVPLHVMITRPVCFDMTSWLEQGRPAILEAISSVCDRIDQDVRKGNRMPLAGKLDPG
jgi:hypothetical protein